MDQHVINRAFEKFPKITALIIGDVMIDSYYFGTVDRVSPEAPVPVVSVTNKDNRLGGAANVALNIKALGANPILCTVIGADNNGSIFEDLLAKNHLPKEGVVRSDNRPTTVKTRIISHQQQMLRIDEESTKELSTGVHEKLKNRILDLLEAENIGVVIFEDYDKGVITPDLIEVVVNACRLKNIPVTVDPKKRNFADYKGVSLFKPNLKELREGLNIHVAPVNFSNLRATFTQLCETMKIESVLITLSELGMYFSDGNSEAWVPAHFRNISDVSGAGDTVISVISLCLAAGMDPIFSTKLANLAGGLVCEKVGVVPIEGQQLENEAMRLSK